jgi:hypothetical protein
MKKKIFKVLGVAILSFFTLASCKKETTTPTNSTSSNTSDTTKNTLGASGFNIKVNTTNYEFIGDKTGISKDSINVALIVKDKSTGKYNFLFMYQKKENSTDTTMFMLTAPVSSLSNTNFTSTSKDTLMVLTALTGKSGFMYSQEDVRLTFTNSTSTPVKGSIISGSINGKIIGLDFSTLPYQQVSHPISGTFKAVYFGESSEFESNQPVAMKKELKKSMIEKYNKLLKAQND